MSKFAHRKLPPPEQMPAKKLAALREMMAIAQHGAAKTIKSESGVKK